MSCPNASLACVRTYAPNDKSACLAVFDSNKDLYFDESERPEFEAFLDNLSGPYFVGFVADRIVSCGGYAADLADANLAVFCWGMVDRAHHRGGFGRRLAQVRLDHIEAAGAFQKVRLSTSQHSYGFYEKLGFTVSQVTKDGLLPGLDEYRMERSLL